ncbi:Uncharacterised protein [Vibrio cholerae]|nr:Uncharacterised protein [Vibrio cholerae]CSD06492.1 Uncharacterised protein [Vibrio cholerae]CSI85167.1 Uncharacterised protein [Vibrio cholerae]
MALHVHLRNGRHHGQYHDRSRNLVPISAVWPKHQVVNLLCLSGSEREPRQCDL